jgi:hypothetical protein
MHLTLRALRVLITSNLIAVSRSTIKLRAISIISIRISNGNEELSPVRQPACPIAVLVKAGDLTALG